MMIVGQRLAVLRPAIFPGVRSGGLADVSPFRLARVIAWRRSILRR